MDTMLLCVCPVKNVYSQNVVGTTKGAHKPQPSVSLMFLPRFDFFCDLLLYRPTATWIPFFFSYDKKAKFC